MCIFYYCIYTNIDEFIDWEKSTCSFDSQDFVRVLEFANKFPEEPDYNSLQDIFQIIGLIHSILFHIGEQILQHSLAGILLKINIGNINNVRSVPAGDIIVEWDWKRAFW